MNKRYYYLILLFLSVLISLTTAYAADNHTGMTDTDTCVDTARHIQGTDDKVVKADYTAKIDQNVINKAENNSKIYLKNGNYNIDRITVNNNITIIGEDMHNTIIKTGTSNHIFNITGNSHLILQNITIKDHQANETPAIINNGHLRIKNTVITNNTNLLRTAKGGAIYNTGILEVDSCELSSNTASWGGSIYNNMGNTTIKNTLLRDDHTYNVGGSVYSIRGNLTVYDSNFISNTGVSGAAIYNAFGNLTVNNTLFLRNDAQSFYGGAIYSTGTAYTNNSRFLYNHAAYSGGAITNTDNFTADNCIFEYNSAGETGGAIENIAWTQTENGNLTLTLCNFTENSATTEGGAIINLNSTTVEGNYGTITARKCIFKENTATERGGAVSNYQYINLQYNIFQDNEAEESSEIYTNPDVIKSVENNWWNTNNPQWTKYGITPKTWAVMNFTNTTPLIEGLDTDLKITLNRLNNNLTLKEALPEIQVVYISEEAEFEQNYQTIKTSITNRCKPTTKNITAKLTNYQITLTPIKADITAELINNNTTIQIKYNLPVNGKTSIKINQKTIIKNRKTDGKTRYTYNIPNQWTKKAYTMTVILNNNNHILNKTLEINIPQRNIDMKTTINKTKIKAGDTIEIKVQLTLKGENITTGKVSFKINHKTIRSNIKVTDSTVTINYTIPPDFNPGNYTITAVYSGDDNKNKATQDIMINLQKQNIRPEENMRELNVLGESNIKIPVYLVDENKNYIRKALACYKINGKTCKTNITITEGVLFVDYITPHVDEGGILKQTLTIKIGENRLYNPAVFNITMIIQ